MHSEWEAAKRTYRKAFVQEVFGGSLLELLRRIAGHQVGQPFVQSPQVDAVHRARLRLRLDVGDRLECGR